ncbi:hypothetical protein FRB96_009293 [Tulasnella sp. 330]|nr:hypothetical protein FRB96_009293 [Tulasnella sp. 330]
MASTTGLKIKISKSRQSTDQRPPERISTTKRSRAGSDDESDADSLSPPPVDSPPTSSRPKRTTVSSGGKSVATDNSDDEDLEGADDADFSDEEGLSVKPSHSRAPSKNTKAKPRRRIQSDMESSPEPDGRVVKPPKAKAKVPAANSRDRGGHDSITSLFRDERSGRMPAESSSIQGKPVEPALKKRKLPQGPPKRAPPASSLLSGSSTAPPNIVKNLKSLSRPTNTNLSGSMDIDLTNMANLTSLMQAIGSLQSHRAPPPGEVQPTQYEELRAEARKARLAANHKTFDLMAGSEKIKAFEAELERMGVWPMPQVLLSAITVPAEGTPSRPP